MNKIICLLLVLLLFITSCNGQSPNDIRANDANVPTGKPELKVIYPSSLDITPDSDITSTSGPSVITRNLIEDRNGNIWCASYEGLIRYNDNVFTNFTKKDSLNGRRVFSLLEDSKGNIWFGTIGAGVYKYKTATSLSDTAMFTQYNTGNGLASNAVECIIEDEEGVIWFGTAAGICSYDGTEFRQYKTSTSEVESVVHAMIKDKDGVIWVGTTGGLFYYDPTVRSSSLFSKKLNPQGQPFYNVRTIIEDSNGKLWLGGSDGLYTYDKQTFQKIRSDFASCVYEGSDGTIWVAAGSGGNPNGMNLYRYIRPATSFLVPGVGGELIKKGEGLIFGMLEDQEGNLWVGTTEGVCRYDGETFNFFH